MAYYNKFPNLLFQQLHPYTVAWINAMTVKPTGAAAKVYDNFVRALVNGNVWNALDILAGTPTHDEQSSLLNVVNPGTNNFSKVGNAAFTAYTGWATTGGAGYLISSSNMRALTKYQQNNAHFGVYTINNTAAASQVDVGTPSSSNVVINPRSEVNTFDARINMTGLYRVSSSNSSGHNMMVRTSSTAIEGFKNGASLGAGSSTSSAVPATHFGMLAGPSAKSARTCTIAHCGASLTSTQAAALSAAINQFVTEAGAL